MKQRRSSHVALRHLKKDPVMNVLIDQFGLLELRVHQEDLFAEIVDSIISQQLSGKVAAVIYTRLENLLPKKKISATGVLKVKDDTLRAVGMSWAKVKYIKDLAEKSLDGTLQLSKLHAMSDEDVMSHLVQVKGVGRWTAEMILIFSLNRPDVFSMGDLGLRTAVSKLYRVDRDNLKKIEKISFQWKPFRSYASRYLWKSLDNE